MSMKVADVPDTGYAYRSSADTLQAKALFQPETECTKEEPRVIGQASFEYGDGGAKCWMTAGYAPESTESNPVVQVTVDDGGKTRSYQVAVNEVNPRSATEIEMFALLSYTDDKGISDGGALGSYQKLQFYSGSAAANGSWKGNTCQEDLADKKHDWQSVTISMWEEYSDAGNYAQMMGCMSLNDTMEKFSIRFVDFDSVQFEDRSAETSLTYTGPDVQQAVMTARSETETEASGDYAQIIQEYMDELFQKIEDGDTEPKFQLGGRAYTVREWNELLEDFDSAQDAIRDLIKKQIEERLEQAKKSEANDARLDMITTDTVQARFPMQEIDADGNRKEDVFLIAIDSEGIRCSRPGAETYEWEIRFTEEGQYEKAKEFMEWANDHMDNFLFSAHENFWQDFLGGNLDVNGFQEFLAGTDNGIPNYGVTVGDSMYIDESKAQWAKYMNHPGAEFLTAEEMAEKVAAQIEENQKYLTKLTTPYDEIYRKYHPEYDGSAIFCEYPGGPLYTANEIGERMYARAMLERDRETSINVRHALGLK